MHNVCEKKKITSETYNRIPPRHSWILGPRGSEKMDMWAQSVSVALHNATCWQGVRPALVIQSNLAFGHGA